VVSPAIEQSSKAANLLQTPFFYWEVEWCYTGDCSLTEWVDCIQLYIVMHLRAIIPTLSQLHIEIIDGP